MRSPVLFMVFNRPEQTEISFERIRAARPPRLYVAADGPRKGREGEEALCAEVRRLATAVDWPCEIKTLFRKRNLGCRVACQSAITWFFQNEPEGLIIEDDIVAHPDFFTFCDATLERYRDNPRISVVCGFNYQMGRVHGDASYYFSNNTHIWGWASWARNWKDYDPEPSGYMRFLKEELPKRVGTPRLSAHCMALLLTPFRKSTWDFELMYQTLRHDKLSIIPNYPLVENIGFTTGVNCKEPMIWCHQKARGIPGEIAHPEKIEACLEADMFDIEAFHFGFSAMCREAFRRVEAGEAAGNHELIRLARAFYGEQEALDEIEAITRLATKSA